MGVRCFWLDPVGMTRLSLRVYEDGTCGTRGYHNAHTPMYDVVEKRVNTQDGRWHYEHDGPQRPEDALITYEWPTACACGFAFTAKASKQVFSDRLLRRADTGELRTIRDWDSVPGAMWNLEWLTDIPEYEYEGPDGRSLAVVCPNGHQWYIDSRANNCTLPTDRVHKCWVRHGTPPLITVDKDGVTCAAGAGSIIAGDYHGFLRNGEFT